MNLSNSTFICPLLFVVAIQPLLADGVLRVNGQDVTREEFVWFAQQERTGVIQFFNQKYATGAGEGFWTRGFHGTTPRAELERRTIARVTREKAEQMLFAELGLVTNFTHAKFLAELESMNRERSDAARRREVIYGPVTFTPEQFYRHWLASTGIRAKEILAQSRLAATERDLKRFYAKNKVICHAPAQSSWDFTRVTGGRTNSTEQLTDITDERLAESLDDETLASRLKSVRPGSTFTTNLADGMTLSAKCVGRRPSAQLPFEEVRPRVASRLLDDRYDKLVAERAAKAEVKLNRNELDGIVFE